MNRFNRIRKEFPRLYSAAAIIDKNPSITDSSSCKEGSILKGINIYKDGSDPVSIPDSSYPGWLWKLLDVKKTSFQGPETLSLKYTRYRNAQKMKSNALKSRK